MHERNDRHRERNRARALSLLAGGMLLTVSCAAPMAQLAQPSDVTGCEALGDVALKEPPANHDDRIVALREAAAEKGATHVVEQGATRDGPTSGQIYHCAPVEKPPSRSEQRAGF